jgi:hypothetical protein
VAYNATLSLALRYAAGVTAPTTTTKPTLASASEIHADAYAEVQAGLVAAELSTTVTASSVLDGRVKQAEALLTSAGVMLAKESLGEQAIKNAASMESRARAMLVDLRRHRGFYLANGGTAGTASSGWTGDHFGLDRDTTINQTPGTGDIPYAPEASFDWTDDD